MKSRYIIAASLSLALLAACSPQVPATQPTGPTPSAQAAQSLVKAGQAQTSAQVSQQGERESLSFSFALPADFRTRFADPSRLARVRFEVSGIGLDSPVSVEAAVSEGLATGRINDLPISHGGLRIVTATGFDADDNPLAAFSASAEYVSRRGVSSVSLVLNRRRLLLGRILLSLLDDQPDLAESLDREALQTQLELAMGFRASSGDFLNQPERYNPGNLVEMLPQDGSIPDASAINAAGLGSLGTAEITLALPPGMLTNEPLTLLVTDPASEPLALPAGSPAGSYILAGISAGSWELEVRTPAGELIASTSADISDQGDVDLGTSSLDLSAVSQVQSEVRVNTSTLAEQNRPSTAMNADGDYVVVWDSLQGGDSDIYMQRYNSLGQPQGSEFRVNAYTTGAQTNPDVCMNDDGDFVIAWQGETTSDQSYGIYASRYDRTGTLLSSEIHVNDSTTGVQADPGIACDSSGNFLIAWNGLVPTGQVYAKRYDNSGGEIDSEFRVAVNSTSAQSLGGVGLADDGEFAISWTMPDGISDGIFVRGFDSTGTGDTLDMVIHDPVGSQVQSSLSMDADGDYVVTWSESVASVYAILGLHFDRDHQPLSPEIVVDTPVGAQFNSESAVNPDGSFIVSWSEETADGSVTGIFARHFDQGGTPLSQDLLVNSFTTGVQNLPALAADTDGDFVLAWSSLNQLGNDYEVYIKRYTASGVPRRPGF